MKPRTRPTPAQAIAVTLLVLLGATNTMLAQVSLRNRLNDRSRDRQAVTPAAETSAPAEAPTAVAAPVATPVAAPVAPPAEAASTDQLAQNSTEGRALPSALIQDERVSTVTDAVKSRVGEKLEDMSTEDVIRAAQQRVAALKNGNAAATITDTPATTATPAPPAAATPATAPQAAQPLIPEPAATSARTAPPAAVAAPPSTPAPGEIAQTTPPVGNSGVAPAPVPLRPRYDDVKGTSSQAMEIESDESIMDNAQNLITFEGNVVVNHPDFKLIGDHLQVYLNEESNLEGGAPAAPAAPQPEGENKPAFKRAIATGGMVEIEQIGADGKVQVAKARRADYDGLTGDIVLSGGPPTLQSSSGGFINPSSPDAVIILRGNGMYEVKGASGGSGRSSVSIPISTKDGPKSTGGPLSGGLDSITTRRSQ